MKRNILMFALILLAIAFEWSCTKDAVGPSSHNDVEVSTRMGKGNGNGGGGNNGGGSAPHFEITYDGTIVTSEKAIGNMEKQSKKFDLMDGNVCGNFELYGIDDLMTLMGSADCYSLAHCSFWHAIRQYDKKNQPEKVTVRFTFYDPGVTAERIELVLVGDIQDQINGKYTIVPTATEDVVINFFKWKIGYGMGEYGDDDCEQAVIFFTDMPTPAPSDQSMTIGLVEAEDPCAGYTSNCE